MAEKSWKETIMLNRKNYEKHENISWNWFGLSTFRVTKQKTNFFIQYLFLLWISFMCCQRSTLKLMKLLSQISHLYSTSFPWPLLKWVIKSINCQHTKSQISHWKCSRRIWLFNISNSVNVLLQTLHLWVEVHGRDRFDFWSIWIFRQFTDKVEFLLIYWHEIT